MNEFYEHHYIVFWIVVFLLAPASVSRVNTNLEAIRDALRRIADK